MLDAKVIEDFQNRISDLSRHFKQKEEKEKQQKLQTSLDDLKKFSDNNINPNQDALNEFNRKKESLEREVKTMELESQDIPITIEDYKEKNLPDASLEIKGDKNNDAELEIKGNNNDLELDIESNELYKALDLATSKHVDFFKEEDRDPMKVIEGLLPKDAGGKPEWGALAIAGPIVVFNMMMNAMICVLANLETFNKEREEKRKEITEKCASMNPVEMERKMGNDMLTSWALTPSRSKEEVDTKLNILKNQGFHINEDIQEKMRNMPNSPLITMAGGVHGGLLYNTLNASYENGDKLLDLKARMDGYKKNKNYTIARDNVNKNLAHIMKDRTPLPQIKESVDRIEELMDPWQIAQNKIESEKSKEEEIRNSPPKPDIAENKPINSDAHTKNENSKSTGAIQHKEGKFVNNGEKESAQPPLPGEKKEINSQNPGAKGSNENDVASSNKGVLDQVTGNNSFVSKLERQNSGHGVQR